MKFSVRLCNEGHQLKLYLPQYVRRELNLKKEDIVIIRIEKQDSCRFCKRYHECLKDLKYFFLSRKFTELEAERKAREKLGYDMISECDKYER